MRTDDLDFDLPPELIAQSPAERRDLSMLLHYVRDTGAITRRSFSDLPRVLRGGDLLVFNDSKVVPARFTLRKETGALIDGLFLGEVRSGVWRVMLRNMGPALGRPMRFEDAPHIAANVVSKKPDGEYELSVGSDLPALRLLADVGRMPLPPYIKRRKHHDDRDADDRRRYQTVYAQPPGSVAAPTAGLHFTDELLQQLDAAGVERTMVTLHVGLGTFKGISADTLDAHAMHSERYSIGPAAAAALNRAKQAGRRIIAVGTTAARVLESQSAVFAPIENETSIFIYPPYRWKHVNALITNFHLPRSTLIALVAAFVGLEQQRCIYAEAIRHRYRFFSYGDCCLLE